MAGTPAKAVGKAPALLVEAAADEVAAALEVAAAEEALLADDELAGGAADEAAAELTAVVLELNGAEVVALAVPEADAWVVVIAPVATPLVEAVEFRHEEEAPAWMTMGEE